MGAAPPVSSTSATLMRMLQDGMLVQWVCPETGRLKRGRLVDADWVVATSGDGRTWKTSEYLVWEVLGIDGKMYALNEAAIRPQLPIDK